MTSKPVETKHYDGPAGGWGSLRGIGETFAREMATPAVIETLARQNKAEGHMCTSCAWGKPAHPHVFEFCENGAKATIWELTRDRCTPDFFAGHTLTDLRGWSDYDLEMTGRLTEPLRYDPAVDKYVPCAWDRPSPASPSSCSGWSRNRWYSMPPARPRWKRRIYTLSSPGCTGTIIFPTVRTCATKRHPSP